MSKQSWLHTFYPTTFSFLAKPLHSFGFLLYYPSQLCISFCYDNAFVPTSFWLLFESLLCCQDSQYKLRIIRQALSKKNKELSAFFLSLFKLIISFFLLDCFSILDSLCLLQYQPTLPMIFGVFYSVCIYWLFWVLIVLSFFRDLILSSLSSLFSFSSLISWRFS